VSLHGIVLVIRSQLLDLIENILTDQVPLLDPSRYTGCGAHFDEMAIVVENFYALAIFHDSGFFIYCRHVVAEIGLNGGNVSCLLRAASTTIAR
jgi:hypothetical protein